MQLQLDAQSTLKALSEADLRQLAQHLGVDPKYKTGEIHHREAHYHHLLAAAGPLP